MSTDIQPALTQALSIFLDLLVVILKAPTTQIVKKIIYLGFLRTTPIGWGWYAARYFVSRWAHFQRRRAYRQGRCG